MRLALKHCHCGTDQVVLHRDIKPGNVFLDAHGNIKVRLSQVFVFNVCVNFCSLNNSWAILDWREYCLRTVLYAFLFLLFVLVLGC